MASPGLQPVNEIVLDGYNIIGGFITQPFCVYDAEHLSIEAIVYGGSSPTGVYTVEASSELFSPTNFTTLTTTNVSDNSITLWNFCSIGYNWVRLSFSYTSGTGLISVIFNRKVRYA